MREEQKKWGHSEVPRGTKGAGGGDEGQTERKEGFKRKKRDLRLKVG